MSRLRVLIADDEPLARRGVRQLLEPHGDMHVVGEARDGREAVRFVAALRPDLLFLDVQMPENDAFGVLERYVAEYAPAVVFLTAFEDYAVRAFDVGAVDYLVKPPTRARFELALTRARDQIRRLAGERGAGAPVSGVAVDTRDGQRLVTPDEIDWIEAADYYAAVHAHGRRYLVRSPLDALESRLPGDLFMRVHRCALVNLARIERLAGARGGGYLILSTGARVPVSRRRRPALDEWLRSIDR